MSRSSSLIVCILIVGSQPTVQNLANIKLHYNGAIKKKKKNYTVSLIEPMQFFEHTTLN